MKTVFTWGNTVVFLIAVMITFTGCVLQLSKTLNPTPISMTAIANTAIPSKRATPTSSATPFVSLLTVPSHTATKEITPTVGFTPSPTASSAFEPTTAWGDPDSQYDSILISASQQMIVYRFRDQSLTTISIHDGKEVDFLEVQQVTAPCHFLTSVKTQQDGLRFSLEIYDLSGALIQEVFHLENKDPNIVVKFHPGWSPSNQYVSYVVYTGQLFYDTAQYQDIEVVQVNQPGNPIRLTERGGAWKEGGAWSPKGDQIAYTDYDEQGVLQVYISDLVKNTRQAITHFTGAGQKPGPIQWSPSGEEIIVFMGETQDALSEAWVVAVPTSTVRAVPKPSGVSQYGGTLWWSETGDKILLSGGDAGSAGLYWLDARSFHLLHSLTDGRAASLNESANSIGQPFSLAADLSVVGFTNSMREFFAYQVFDQKVELITGLDGKAWETIWDIKAFPEEMFLCTRK